MHSLIKLCEYIRCTYTLNNSFYDSSSHKTVIAGHLFIDCNLMSVVCAFARIVSAISYPRYHMWTSVLRCVRGNTISFTVNGPLPVPAYSLTMMNGTCIVLHIRQLRLYVSTKVQRVE